MKRCGIWREPEKPRKRIALVPAATIVSDVSALARFATPRQLMG